jgi:hypothetical protein
MMRNSQEASFLIETTRCISLKLGVFPTKRVAYPEALSANELMRLVEMSVAERSQSTELLHIRREEFPARVG